MRLSIHEASQKLGVTEHTIRRRLRKGELQGEQVPRPQGFTWVVVVDDNEVGDQPTHAGPHVVAQEASRPVQAPAPPEPQPIVQPPKVEPPPPSLSPVQMAELHALRARVAVLEERDQSKNDLIDLLQDRLKSQDWQFGEVLNQLNEVQSRMLPPPSIEIQEPENEQASGGWMFWRKGRAKAQV
ncbi:MAG: hypothetical protein QF898_11200 [SAR202 cluster bacterium]|nr:hypothetical protein [SAR202 cluster bacterium]MDP6513108.1 hypothetical protein [SAR202 cluster bacterium]MDP6715672.1 hypothetical protein [SAR202 cluster bacterium]